MIPPADPRRKSAARVRVHRGKALLRLSRGPFFPEK
jgi:hypothetical protein